MSYKNNTPDSYIRSSGKGVAKYIVPFIVGFLVAIFIWAGWLFPQIEGEGEVEVDVNFVMTGFFIIILLVEIPIAGIVIYFTYRNKVVKMKPESAYKIENINDYLQAHERYQGGNYEYETIKSEEDIIKAHENGKKIVFTARKSGEKILIWMGIAFFIIGLIISIASLTFEIDIEFKIIAFSISLSIPGAIGAIFFLPNFIRLKRLPRSFFVLGREGIVYRRIWGDIRSYSWKELDLKIYSVKTIIKTLALLKTELFQTIEIHMILPNGAILKFEPEEYHLDEILSFDKLKAELKNSVLSRSHKYMITLKNRNLTLYMVSKTFKHYFDSGKKELTSISH